METDSPSSGGWRFAQCFGDKGEVEDITEGKSPSESIGLDKGAPHERDGTKGVRR